MGYIGISPPNLETNQQVAKLAFRYTIFGPPPDFTRVAQAEQGASRNEMGTRVMCIWAI